MKAPILTTVISLIASALFAQTNTFPSNGNVGIGTSSPDNTLTIDGSLGFFRNGAYPTTMSPGFIKYESGFVFGNSSTADPLIFQTNSIDRIYVENNGNVGIGTSSPDAKLAVKGSIHTQEVKVDLNGAVAPDYVFEKNYNLRSLEEVNSYIQQNKHLPEVPSAKEFEAEGMKLKEMNLLLLKKVEELTLYLVEQNKITTELTKRVDLQNNEIERLKCKAK